MGWRSGAGDSGVEGWVMVGKMVTRDKGISGTSFVEELAFGDGESDSKRPVLKAAVQFFEGI